MEVWQQRWDSNDKSRKVYNYIDQIDTGKIYLNYYANQVVTGHGVFPDFQHKISGHLYIQHN